MGSNNEDLELQHILEFQQTSFVKTRALEIFYPCTTMGNLYREEVEGEIVPVGCREAFQLGRINFNLYEEIKEKDLQHPMYKIYRKLTEPGIFLVLPNFYRIGRYDPSKEEHLEYRPAIFLQSVIDTNIPTNNFFSFHMMLTPDLPLYIRKELQLKLLSMAKNPQIEYPTQITEAQYNLKMNETELVASTMSESFQAIMNLNLAGVIALRDMMERYESAGTIHFKLKDGSNIASTLILDLDNITGPWETGPIEVKLVEGAIQLTNKIERPIDISKLIVYRGLETLMEIEVNIRLDSDKTHAVNFSGNKEDEIYPVYSFPPAPPALLEELRSFMQDTFMRVEFLILLNYSNYNIKELQIKTRLKNKDKIYGVPLTGNPLKGFVDIILPLTENFYQTSAVQFQFVKIFNSGESSETEWLDWDLPTKGNIVSVTWEMIK
ncbi:hypothetical protein [Priestia megaterium]|uniref:hypothetical protein n=1 Tax=Priestia megaterium TaxID=1404 RepID=UPI003008C4CF